MGGRRAVIAGAGIGGLTAAVALHRRGWQVRVLERAPRLEPVGTGISLWPNALRAFDAVGVGSGLRARAGLSGPSGVRRPDGRWLARADVGSAVHRRFGDPLVVVHRAELVDLLAGALPHQDVEDLRTPLPSFHQGHTVMVGDAAHAMTPDLGQGGCMAAEDAVVLAALLDAEPVPAALATYTARRLPRTTAVAARSRRAGLLVTAPYPVQGMAARLMGLIPDLVVARGLAPVVDWHPPEPPRGSTHQDRANPPRGRRRRP